MGIKKSRIGQIWVETVIYTIIGLVIIGIVLAVATPAINRYKDKIVIEQTISTLNDLNSEILDVRNKGIGNKRSVDIIMKRGTLTIESQEEKIYYFLEESSFEYSEAGENASYGDIKIRTEEKGRKYSVTLTLDYENINLTYNGKEEEKSFNPAPTPYKLFISNNGTINGITSINIQEGS